MLRSVVFNANYVVSNNSLMETNAPIVSHLAQLVMGLTTQIVKPAIIRHTSSHHRITHVNPTFLIVLAMTKKQAHAQDAKLSTL